MYSLGGRPSFETKGDAKSRIAALALIAILMLPLLSIAVPSVLAAEAIKTDKSIYVIRWKGEVPNLYGYVNITITMTGLVPNHLYQLKIWRKASVEYRGAPPEPTCVRQVNTTGISGIPYVEIKITLSEFRDYIRRLAGTYYAELYDLTAGKKVAGPVYFGIWGLTSPIYNFCDEIIAIGGGFNKTKDSTVTLLGETDIAGERFFPEDIPVDENGVFEAIDGHLMRYVNGTCVEEDPTKYYTIELTNFAALTVDPYETEATFTITKKLEVSVWTEFREYERTQTMKIFVQVTKQSGRPDENAVIDAEVYNRTGAVFLEWNDNKVSGPYVDTQKKYATNWTMVQPGLYSATYHIHKDDEVGNWTVGVFVDDPCGNEGSANSWTIVKPATIHKVIWVQPQLSLQKTDTAFMLFNVTYPDGSPATLDITASKVLVIFPDGKNTTAVIKATDYAGVYNATYYIKPTDLNGTYRFLIEAYALVDNVKQTWFDATATVPNKGPAEDNYSNYFVVGPFALLVEVWTDKPAYAKGETVYITATARYKDGSYLCAASVPNWYGWPHTVVPGSKVWVDIYWPNGSFHKTISLVFTPPTPTLPPRWTGTYPTTVDYPAGIYNVSCTADDKKGNVGHGYTKFLLAGLILAPAKGTVPPDWEPYLSYNATTGIVSAQLYVAGAKILGTVVTVSADANTLPANTTFILTIEAADLPTVTKDWYSNPKNLNVKDVATKGIQVAEVTTNPDGSMTPITFVWPSMPSGTYTLLAIKKETATPWTKAKALAFNDFTVIPGLIVAPKTGGSAYITGNTLCEVVATGYPVDAVWKAPWWDASTKSSLQLMTALLLNGTDALASNTIQSWAYWLKPSSNNTIPIEWRFDGTATMTQAFIAKPGFVLPVLQPGVYEVELQVVKVNTTGATTTITALQSASDTIAVYGVVRELVDLIKALDAKIVALNGTVARIDTKLGEVQLSLTDIGGKVTAIKDTVATIQTDLGTVTTSLESIGAKIEDIKGTLATVSTSLGKIDASLTDIGAKVTTIDGKMATIETAIGTVNTALADIQPKVTNINGKIATIETSLGTVQTDVTSIKGTVGGMSAAVYAAAVLSLVAAIAAIVAVIQITRKVYVK